MTWEPRDESPNWTKTAWVFTGGSSKKGKKEAWLFTSDLPENWIKTARASWGAFRLRS